MPRRLFVETQKAFIIRTLSVTTSFLLRRGNHSGAGSPPAGATNLSVLPRPTNLHRLALVSPGQREFFFVLPHPKQNAAKHQAISKIVGQFFVENTFKAFYCGTIKIDFVGFMCISFMRYYFFQQDNKDISANMRKALPRDIVRMLTTWSGMAMMVALLPVGMIFWHPGYRAWGIVAVGVIIAMLIWMFRGLHERTNAVAGNPIHWVWLSMAVYLSVIQFFGQYCPKIETSSGIRGFLNISVILQLLTLSLGCLLFQEFMSKGQIARWLREISAVFIIVLSLSLDSLFSPETPQTAMWLTGCTGVMMAAANAFSAGSSVVVGVSGINRRHQIAIWGQLIIATAGFLCLLSMCTAKSFCLFFVITATVAGIAFICRKRLAASVKFYMTLGILWWLIIIAGCLGFYMCGDGVFTFWGHGEKGARYFWGIDDGITVLFNLVGFVGVGGMFAGLVAVSMAVIVKNVSRSDGNFWKAVLWLTACWLATAAWMSGKTFFSVMPLPIMMMSWGLLFTFSDVRVRWHRAWRFALPMALGLFWLAIANEATIFQKAAFAFGYNDLSLHKIAGTAFCIMMAWWFARRRWWWAIPAVIIAALAGGACEVFQKYFSFRSEDMKDWEAHLKGVAVAAPMLIFIFAGRTGLICRDDGIVSVVGSWKKYVRMSGIAGQAGLIGIAFYFWGGLLFDALPRAAYGNIDIIATDYVIADDHGKFGKDFLFPAVCNQPLYSGSSEFFGYYKNDENMKMFTCFTLSSRKMAYMSFFVGCPPEGTYRLALLGDPFSPCGYLKRNVMFQVLKPDDKLILMDTDSVLKWAAKNKDRFVTAINALRKQYKVIFIHPGPWKKYCSELPTLRNIFPDIPAVGSSRNENWDFRQAVSLFRSDILIHKNQPRIVCLSDSPHIADNFAASLGDYNCVRSVVVKPNYRLSGALKANHRRHLFLQRDNIMAVLDELEGGGISRR